MAWPPSGEKNLYSDLMEEFAFHGDDVAVVSANGPKNPPKKHLCREGGVRVLRVPTGRLQKVGKYRKVLSSFLAGPRIFRAVKKAFRDERFDLVLFSTPPITLIPYVIKIKRLFRAPMYLLLKDIWPDDTVGLGGMKSGGIVWKVFRLLAKRTYDNADFIGCMSDAAVRYLLEHNPVPDDKVEVCPNSRRHRSEAAVDRQAVRLKFGIPPNKTVLIFGGNLGKSQGVGFLLDIAGAFFSDEEIYFLIVGSGTAYAFLEKGIHALGLTNAKIMPALPVSEYERLAAACDIGLIFLAPAVTVPNFPSRVLSYLMAGIPVIAATDGATDLGEILEAYGCGIRCLNGDLRCFQRAVSVLTDRETRLQMGANSKRLFLERYTTELSYRIITEHFRQTPAGEDDR